MARYLTSQEMQKLLIDHLYGLITLTEIAERHHCSTGNIHHKLRALVHGLGFHHATRDPHIISAALYRRDRRNGARANTPQAVHEHERGLTIRDEWS